MSYFSYDQLAITLVVICAFLGVFLLGGNVYNMIRAWVDKKNEKHNELSDKVGYLKNENTRRQQDYKDVVNLKRQVGEIQESVSKINTTLDTFIQTHNTEMKQLNEETALQSESIKALLDSIIENNHKDQLVEKRQKVDEFLIHRGR